MNARPGLGSLSDCPDRNALSAFGGGRLSEPEMERLAEHLGTCARCETSLQELIRLPADSFEAGLLRACVELSATFANSANIGLDLTRSRLVQTDTATFLASKASVARRPTERKTLGPYDLGEILGRGGMGIVYRAVHRVLRRTVAVKTLYPNVALRADAIARFRLEGEVVARLEHPNVVRLHDFNECDGIPYFSMELVEGETLAQKLKSGPLEFRKAAELIRTIAEAIDYAHGQNVVHRDLKPSNVLLAADGTPKVSDFGLAKVLDDGRPKMTETDAVMGTPSYMAPEQAAGRLAEVGPRTDVYALGAILYELLSGVPPFVAEYRMQILDLVREGKVVPPSRRRKDVPSDLEAVCLKCLATLPRDRYESANALANDLDRWLNGQRTTTRRPGFVRRQARHATRRRIAAGLLIVAGTAGLLAAVPPLRKQTAAADAPVVVQSEEIRTPEGKLLPFRVRYGHDKSKVTANADGTITVSTWDLCLVEYTLDPNSARTPYRFRAGVRHEASDQRGRVGLYFTHRAFPGTFGETHLMGRMAYNDIRTIADSAAEALQPPPISIPNPDQNVVRMDFVVLVPGRERPWMSMTELTAGAPFKVCGRRGDCWRALDVRIAPEDVSGLWESRTIGSAPADKINAAFADNLIDRRKKSPDDFTGAALVSHYEPNGRIGLVVERSSATFREIEVIPSEVSK